MRLKGYIQQISHAFQEENRALFFWAAALYGLGIGLYFLMPVEPPLWPSIVALVIVLVLTGFAPDKFGLKMAARGLLIAIAGFGVATLRTDFVDTKALTEETGPIELQGSVVRVEDRIEGGLRLTLQNLRYENGRQNLPEKVRIVVRTDFPDLRPGMIVKTRAILLPLPEPVIPGGYDFARQLWFEGLGAVGFAINDVRVLANPEKTYADKLAGLRQSLYQRITESAPGPGGAVSAALITGVRDSIPEDVSENMRIAGLAHLLAISGLHMALVTGFIFVALQTLLALIPRVALKFPVKKIAAIGAILGAIGYLMISGASISAQRAFIMVAIVLIAVLVDRRAISMRLVALAAIAILTLAPEALLHPSFQMSFAAVIGLIAGYTYLKPKMAEIMSAHPGVMGKVRLYLLGVLVSTIVAEIMIGPIALYHFGRFALYGLPANMLAVPIMGFLVMPLGLLGLVLTPFGLDAYIWQAMAFFMSIILDIAEFAAHLPQADFMVPKIPHTALMLVVFAGLWLCLWQTAQIRKWFYVPILLGAGVYVAYDLPDVIVNREGRLIAVSDGEGRYYFNSLRSAAFSRENWQRALGAEEVYEFSDYPFNENGRLACDDLGCLLNRGTKVAFAYDPQAFAEDCKKADIIITAHYAPFPCKDAKIVIDRSALRKNGAHAIWLGRKIIVRSSGEERGRRPWTNSDQ